MLNRLQNYFIGHHLRQTDDVFEHARTIMMYRFSLMFTVLFFLPLSVDIMLGYEKLVVLHAADMIAIIAFPFMMRKIRSFDTQITIFFLITTSSSWLIFLMANPMRIDLIGLAWVIFFSTLSALLQRGVRRILFSFVLPWFPLVYVLINIHLKGALTLDWMLEKAAADPPLFLMAVPITLLLFAIWSHTTTISIARATITSQKNEIENKNKDITDSINYARHLQEALLPPVDEIAAEFQGSQVYYRPKAIVAGDFYWMEKTGTRVFIAAADCTGHGVPGAMVSVVCSAALTRSVREFNLTETGRILDNTRELVIETFAKSSDAVNDGMDISLLCVDRATGKITWSGANNSLWIVDNGVLHITKADKQPVGKNEHHQAFTTHEINVAKGAAVYLLTDGFADQFGGPDGKKFKYKQLGEFLVSNHSLPPKERMDKLDRVFNQWKGNLEQVDDICIIFIDF